jgi:hypothetical protein
MRIAAAAALYFAIVFGVGFLLGPIRVLWLEPRAGPIVAVACEAPLLLAAMALAARWVPRVVRLRRDWVPLLAMGVGALVLQQLADFAVGTGLAGYQHEDIAPMFARAPANCKLPEEWQALLGNSDA